MRTGCRCRKMFDNITSTRLRSVSGRSCRKTDVHTCVSVSQFQKRVPALSFGLTVLTCVAMDKFSVVSYQLSVFPGATFDGRRLTVRSLGTILYPPTAPAPTG